MTGPLKVASTNNLVGNAVKFTPSGGHISVRAHLADCTVRPGRRWEDPKGLEVIERVKNGYRVPESAYKQCVQFAVSDTGIGIKAEDAERIFAPFEQVNTASHRRYQGTGLGLSLTRKLVELHGGSMWVVSEGEGKGSTFSFTIPLEH